MKGGMLMKKREETLFWIILVKLMRFMLILLGIIVSGIVAVSCLGRFVGFNFSGFEELLVIAVFWLYMFGCAYGSYEDSQIKADILEVMMHDGLAKDIIRSIKYILTFVLGVVMLIWAIQLVNWSILQGTMTTVYRLPTTIGHASMVVGLLLSAFYNACYCYSDLKKFYFKNIKKNTKEVTV